MDQQPVQSTPVSPLPVANPAPQVSPMQPAAGPVAPPPLQVRKFSNMWIVIIVVIALILAVAGWFVYSSYMTNMTKSANSKYQGAYYEKQVSPTAMPTPTIGAVKSGDAQLDQQSDAIDTSMDKLNTDISNVDKGLQDSSVNLN